MSVPSTALLGILDSVICGDNAAVMATWPDACIDLVVTSPPYDDLRKYGGHSWDFPAVARELTRILKPGGVIVWVVGDATVDGSETLTSMKQAIHFREVCGLNVWDTMIYRTNKPPQSGRRYEPCWEYMFCFSSGMPTTWNPLREATLAPGAMNSGGMRRTDAKMKPRSLIGRTGEDRLRENIWYLPRSPHSDGTERNDHPATFPDALARDHILTWSNPGDVVLDPFAGSGTTLKMAKEHGRRWIGIEVNPAYVEICWKRVAQGVLPLVPNSVIDVTSRSDAKPTSPPSAATV
jgi:site-specific DNA-methyltransferase (adenine-specific)